MLAHAGVVKNIKIAVAGLNNSIIRSDYMSVQLEEVLNKLNSFNEIIKEIRGSL